MKSHPDSGTHQQLHFSQCLGGGGVGFQNGFFRMVFAHCSDCVFYVGLSDNPLNGTQNLPKLYTNKENAFGRASRSSPSPLDSQVRDNRHSADYSLEPYTKPHSDTLCFLDLGDVGTDLAFHPTYATQWLQPCLDL